MPLTEVIRGAMSRPKRAPKVRQPIALSPNRRALGLKRLNRFVDHTIAVGTVLFEYLKRVLIVGALAFAAKELESPGLAVLTYVLLFALGLVMAASL
ncbi:MAG: hypothetical protein EOP19_20650, partial [Hyphomicrobiales bacterium]